MSLNSAQTKSIVVKWLKRSLIAAFSIFLILFIIGLLAPKNAIRAQETTTDQPVAEKKKQYLLERGRVLSWKELPNDVKEQVGDYCSYYVGGWAIHNSTQFKKEEAYYVNIKVDNRRLAELSKSKAFPVEETLAQTPFFLYGKYKNRWTFQDSLGSEIAETAKFAGFSTIEIKRTGGSDEVWIGPIPAKPAQLTILLRGDDTETKPTYKF